MSQLWLWATPLVERGPFTINEVVEVAALSTELTNFILPRLHTGESVEMIAGLSEHLASGDALEATSSLLTKVEIRLDELELRRDLSSTAAASADQLGCLPAQPENEAAASSFLNEEAAELAFHELIHGFS